MQDDHGETGMPIPHTSQDGRSDQNEAKPSTEV